MCLIVFLVLVCLQCCAAYDAIIFSSLPLNKVTVHQLASVTSPRLLALGVQEFSLPKFLVFAQAYSEQPLKGPFTSLMRLFGHVKALPMEEPLKITQDSDKLDKTSAKGIVYRQVESLEELLNLFAQQNDLASYQTVVVSSPDAFESELTRRKRVSSDVTFDDKSMAAPSDNQSVHSAYFEMPVLLPPENYSLAETDQCLLYMEAFDVIIRNKDGASFIVVGNGDATFEWDPNYYNCDMDNATWGNARLDFVGIQNNGYWSLKEVELLKPFNITGNQNLTVEANLTRNDLGIESVPGFSFACSKTQAAFFSTTGGAYVVGIALSNFEVDLGPRKSKAEFGYYVSDCVGTFSAGSWM
ncbi:unnamed protein product, partial [Gongylonema pulchrum]|uniref:Peptidase A1 domain-containing protein n=1 Tax=Gongylonema pulchrum TaxID=637853 RepID=A0A183D1Y9_9BILA